MSGDLQTLFEVPPTGSAMPIRMRVVLRHRQPFLYLPSDRWQALQALPMYPAQRTVARIARTLLRLSCTMGLSPLLPSMVLSVDEQSPFAQFLASVTGRKGLPAFAVLAGNPNAPGRRFVFLLFDAHSRPVAVVKAGASPEGMRLIDREARVLEGIPVETAGVPRLRGAHRSEKVHALALDYAPGNAPVLWSDHTLAAVLEAWIDGTRIVRAGDVPIWKHFTQTCAGHPILEAARHAIEPLSFHPVLYHGDFAPWNIRVSAGDELWKVLDWERGELVGLPCWDWFHYRIQPDILVNRLATRSLEHRIEAWLGSQRFLSYAETAGVRTVCRELLLAYLLYNVEIIRPSEGLQLTRDLLNVLAHKWGNA